MTDHNLPHGYRWGTDEEWERFADEPFLGAILTPIMYSPGGIYRDRSIRHLAVLEDRNLKILTDRLAQLDEDTGPRVGDYVKFSDGVVRRFSHAWDEGIQTSDGGRWYFGNGYLSFSGSLFAPIPFDTLIETGDPRLDTRWGNAWFFHHDWAKADNGVDVLIPLRVYHCTQPSNNH